MKDYLSLAKNYLLYWLWIVRGRSSPPANIIFKRRRLSKLAKTYNCTTFIETGTADGKTLVSLRKIFKKLLSVEIYRPCFEMSLKRTSRYKNIELYYGDSKLMLPLMISKIEGKALFWLDGHYSGEGTGKSEKNCPVLEELEVIKSHKRKDHLILIDDAREFNGTNDYPTINEIIEKLKEINTNSNIRVDFDCIISIPQN
jgi:hypothetical protein